MANEDGTDSSPNTLNVTQMKFPGFSSPHLPPLHSKLGDLVLAHSIGKERMYWGGERRGWFPADYILSHEKRRGRKKLKEGRDIGVLLLRGACATIHFADFYTGYLDLDNSVISKVPGMDVILELL
jgi:hypothetical protein